MRGFALPTRAGRWGLAEMASALFTVLLPVVRPPALLPYAVESVLAQTLPDFRLCIICDGAPDDTIACARSYAHADSRVEVFDFDKGERNGEAHRHTVLASAHSTFVAHIGDDDLWFPDYLAEAARLLEQADFGNLLQAERSTDGSIHVPFGDLADPAIRDRMMRERWNFFGPTVASYRLAAYRRLPVGWSPAPAGLWSDLHMWRKFFALDGLAFATRFAVQSLKMPADARRSIDLTERARETAAVAARMQDAGARADVQAAAACSVVGDLRHTIHVLSDRSEELRRVRDEVVVQRDALQARLDQLTGRSLVRAIASLAGRGRG